MGRRRYFLIVGEKRMNRKILTTLAGSAALTGALMVSVAAPAQAVPLNCGKALADFGHTLTMWCSAGPLNGYAINVSFCSTGGCRWTRYPPVRYGNPITAAPGGFFNTVRVIPVLLP